MDKFDFVTCDFCAKKPETHSLCSGCLHNKDMIEYLNKCVAYEKTQDSETTQKFYKLQTYATGCVMAVYFVYEFISWISN
jgi:hypothetical protein